MSERGGMKSTVDEEGEGGVPLQSPSTREQRADLVYLLI